MRPLRGWRLLALSFVLASAEVATAQDGEIDSDLAGLLEEQVVTTASKSAETTDTVPATVTSITAEQLRAYGIRTLAEAIDFLSLGLMTSDRLRDVEVGARGVLFTGDRGAHVLVLVNGHTVNDPFYGSAQFGRGLGVPLELVDRIEVVIGPGSVLYGSNAMLGVIHVITKRAREYSGTMVLTEFEPGKSVRAGAGVGYGIPALGRDAELTLQLDYYRQFGPEFLLGPVTVTQPDPATGRPLRFRTNGPEDGVWGGRARNSHWGEVPSGLLRLTVGDLDINFHAAAYRRAAPYATAGVPTYPGDFDSPENYEFDRRVFVDARYALQVSTISRVTFRLYGDHFDYGHQSVTSAAAACLYGDTSPCYRRNRALARWAGGEVQSTFNWFRDSRFVTLVGLDARGIYVKGQDDIRNYDTGDPRESSSNVIDAGDRMLAAYLQQTWTPSDRFSLNAGARIDEGRRFDPVVSPRIAAGVGLWRGGRLKGVYSEAFRAPTWTEFASSSRTILRSEALRPERVRSTEVSLEQAVGTHRASIGAFRTWWHDMIAFHVLSLEEFEDLASRGLVDGFRNLGIGQYRNIQSIENYGMNGRLEGSFLSSKLRYGLNATAAIAERDGSDGRGTRLPVSPRFFGNARILYAFGASWPTVALAAQHVSRRRVHLLYPELSEFVPSIPAQTVLRAAVTGDLPVLVGLSYRATADFAVRDVAPYAVGVYQANIPGVAELTYQPVERYRVLLGLAYTFGAERVASP